MKKVFDVISKPNLIYKKENSVYYYYDFIPFLCNIYVNSIKLNEPYISIYITHNNKRELYNQQNPIYVDKHQHWTIEVEFKNIILTPITLRVETYDLVD
jgi:hypothetical protein